MNEHDTPPMGQAAGNSVGFRPLSNVTNDYREATERLANASVAKHAADREFEDAMAGYAEARGAARARGLST